MKKVEVESSFIKSVSLSSDGLIVALKSGAVYLYERVSEKVFDEMVVASSKGEFLNNIIKPNYDFVKLN